MKNVSWFDAKPRTDNLCHHDTRRSATAGWAFLFCRQRNDYRVFCGRVSGHSQIDVVPLDVMGDFQYENYGGQTDRHISIEDAMRVKAAKRPDHPKKM